MKKIILFTSLFLIVSTTSSFASEPAPKSPVLVVDKCPEFCPPGATVPGIKGPVKPPKRMCAQVLIPVPGKKGWFWTDSCKTKMINSNTGKKR